MPIIHIVTEVALGMKVYRRYTSRSKQQSLQVVCKKKDPSHFYTLAPSDLLNFVPVWGKNKTEHQNQFQNKLPQLTHSPEDNNGWTAQHLSHLSVVALIRDASPLMELAAGFRIERCCRERAR